MATMNSGKGGASGYGEDSFKTTGVDSGDLDDGYVRVDVSSVFGDGLTLFGTTYTDLYINSNGSITFGGAEPAFSETIDTANNPMIAPFLTDVDLSNGGDIHWDLDPANGQITITWDGVAPSSGSGANSFQLVLTDGGGGDFDVEVIYGDIQYTNGSGPTATAGFSDGSGNAYPFEGSGNAATMSGYDTNDFDGGDPAGTFATSFEGGFPPELDPRVAGTSGDDLMGVGYVDAAGGEISDGDDSIDGGAGDDTIEGGAGDDTIIGGSGEDVIAGAGGNDVIAAGGGADSISGGDGNDWIEGDGPAPAIDTQSVNISGGASHTFTTDAAQSGFVLDLYTFDNSFSLEINGTQLWTAAGHNDAQFHGSAHAYHFADGSFYNDGTIKSPWGMSGTVDNPLVRVVIGADGSVQFFGARTPDGPLEEMVLQPGTTVNPVTINTSEGSSNTIVIDQMIAGPTHLKGLVSSAPLEWDDVVDGGAGDDTIFGDAGHDTISGGTGSDSINAGAGDDWVTDANGGFDQDGADTIDLGDGNDVFVGSGSQATDQDLIYGGAGNDTITVQQSYDTVYGGDGDDLITSADEIEFFGDELYGEAGNDTIISGNTTDLLDGGADDDSLSGGGASDTLLGGDGNDTLDGGAGNDSLTGGAGDDVFTYTPGSGNDTITDFNSGNTGTLSDGDGTNNDHIDLGSFYDDIWELHADQADDGILNQSNDGVDGADYSDNAQFGSGSLTFTGASADNSSFTSENTGVVCFASGTAIRTPRGDVPVEALRAGDLVSTLDNGARPLIWTGRTEVTFQPGTVDPTLTPVRIKPLAGSGGRALLVSPQHCLLMQMADGTTAFVRARHLAEETRMASFARGRARVSYHHLLLARHEILISEGRPSESFYPGPCALRTLTTLERTRLLGAAPHLDLASSETPYGPRAATVFTRKQVRALANDAALRFHEGAAARLSA